MKGPVLEQEKSHKGPIYVAGSLQCFQTQPSHVFITATPPPLTSCQQSPLLVSARPGPSVAAVGAGAVPGSVGWARGAGAAGLAAWHRTGMLRACHLVMLQLPSPVSEHLGSTQGCSQRGGMCAGAKRRSPSPTLLLVPVWSACCPSGSHPPVSNACSGGAVSSSDGLAAGVLVGMPAPPHAPEVACRTVPWLPPLSPSARVALCPLMNMLGPLARTGCVVWQPCILGGRLASTSARATLPLCFLSPGIRWRAAPSTGLHLTPGWRNSSSQALPWECPCGRTSLSSGHCSCAAHRPCTGVDVSCPICAQPCHPPCVRYHPVTARQPLR